MGDYNGERVIGYRKLLSNNDWANVEHTMITGSCHCQGVNYEIAAEIRGFQHCHCHTCRNIHGTVYGSGAVTSRDGFRIVSGNDKISEYESSPGKKRCFCSNCGSHIYAYMAAKPDIVVLGMGTLDEDPKVRPIRHIWMSHRAPWYEVLDDLPTHDEMPA